MSHQAVAWAIEQRTGSPAAKVVLWSLAGYANNHSVCWPGQDVIAKESEQSIDAVQKRLRQLVERGLIRRIRLRRHGRRWVDFIILSRSALFDMPVDQLRPYMPAECEPMADATAVYGSVEEEEEAANPGESEIVLEDDSPDAAAKYGSVEAASRCRSGDLTLPICSGSNEPVKNQESPNPKPLSPEQAPASEASPATGASGEASPSQSPPDPPDSSDSPEMQKLWSKFCSTYPDGIIDPPRTETEFFKLTLSEADNCIEGAAIYADRCKRRREKPKAAHLFIRKRTYSGLLAEKPNTKRSIAFTLVPFNSKRGRAIANLYLMTPQGEPVRCHGDGGLECYSVPFAPNDQIMAFADVPRRSLWKFYPLSMKQKYAAWGDFIQAHTGKQLRTTPKGSPPGFYAPHPWPPRIDGTWSESPESPPSTGPPSVPQIPELTEDDIDVLTHQLTG